MKKQLLALSMIATSGLMAQTDGPMPSQTHQQDACDPCCAPCCNNPRPCVDCEAYVPQFYNLQCDWGFSFDAEFLYWYGRETNLSYAARVTPTNIDQEDPTSDLIFSAGPYKHLNTSWDPGFRVGLGFNSSCDGWDYNLTWTWYRNTRSETTSVDDFAFQAGDNTFPFIAGQDQTMLLNPWINSSMNLLTFGIGNTTDDITVLGFDSIRAKYRLRFNQVDLDVGRKYWLSKCFNMRPYAGLRGAWTRVTFSTNSTRTFALDDIGFTENLEDKFKTRAWGVGVIAGIEPTWYFGQCFALFAKAGTGVLWGDFEVKKSENYTGSTTLEPSLIFPNYSQTSQSEHAQMTGLLDAALGIRWESTWCCDRYRTTVDLGWEHHIFFDQNHRMKSSDFFEVIDSGSTDLQGIAGYRSYDEATGNLGFGGFVLRLNFDF